MIWSKWVYPHRAVHEVSDARVVEALDEGRATKEPLHNGEGLPRGRAVQLQELPLQRCDHLRRKVNNVPRDFGARGREEGMQMKGLHYYAKHKTCLGYTSYKVSTTKHMLKLYLWQTLEHLQAYRTITLLCPVTVVLLRDKLSLLSGTQATAALPSTHL